MNSIAGCWLCKCAEPSRGASVKLIQLLFCIFTSQNSYRPKKFCIVFHFLLLFFSFPSWQPYYERSAKNVPCILNDSWGGIFYAHRIMLFICSDYYSHLDIHLQHFWHLGNLGCIYVFRERHFLSQLIHHTVSSYPSCFFASDFCRYM